MKRNRKNEERKSRKLRQLNDVQAMKHKELDQLKGAGGGLMQLSTYKKH